MMTILQAHIKFLYFFITAIKTYFLHFNIYNIIFKYNIHIFGIIHSRIYFVGNSLLISIQTRKWQHHFIYTYTYEYVIRI